MVENTLQKVLKGGKNMYSVLEDGEIYVTALTYFEEAEGDFLNDKGQPYKSFEELSEDILWNEDKFFSAYSRNGIRGILDNPKLLDNQKEIIYDAYKLSK